MLRMAVKMASRFLLYRVVLSMITASLIVVVIIYDNNIAQDVRFVKRQMKKIFGPQFGPKIQVSTSLRPRSRFSTACSSRSA